MNLLTFVCFFFFAFQILKSDSTIVGELALGNTTTSHLNETRGHTMGLTCGEWNPKYKEAILTSSRDGSLRLWDVNDLSRHKKVVFPCLFIHIGLIIIACK